MWSTTLRVVGSRTTTTTTTITTSHRILVVLLQEAPPRWGGYAIRAASTTTSRKYGTRQAASSPCGGLPFRRRSTYDGAGGRPTRPDPRRTWLAAASSTTTTPPPPNQDKQETEEPLLTDGVEKGASSNKENEPQPSSWLLPGMGACVLTAGVGFDAASLLSSTTGVPVSGIPVAILLGMGLRNTVFRVQQLPPVLIPGIQFATKSILQMGIICVAAKLSFGEVLHTGTASIPVVVSSVTAGLLFIPAAGAWMGLPRKMSLLLAAGTSICGVTAITALAPAIQATNRDMAVAVASTVAFGSLGMILYPYLFHAVCTSSAQVGLCLGVAIHDTSQVLGSALSYKETFHDEVAFQVAAVTKLIRNLGLAVAIPLLTYQHHQYHSHKDNHMEQHSPAERTHDTTTTNESKSPLPLSGLNGFTKYVPPFLVAFLGMSLLRTTGDFLMPDLEAYHLVMNFTGNDLSKYLLGTAMAGVGLSTDKSSLQGVGWKPFAVGGAGALVVGGTGFTVAMLTV